MMTVIGGKEENNAAFGSGGWMSGSGVLESCRSSVRVGTLRKWDLTLPVTGHMTFGRRMRESSKGPGLGWAFLLHTI